MRGQQLCGWAQICLGLIICARAAAACDAGRRRPPPARPHPALIPLPTTAAQLRSLEGIRYIYTQNIYIYAFLGVSLITLVLMLAKAPKPWARKKAQDAYT